MIAAHKAKLFPEYQAALLRMITHHDQTRIEPLLLAVYYADAHNPEDVYLFQIVKQYGYDEVGPDNDLVEFEYGSTSALPLPEDHFLHILLTNPTECRHAIKNKWPKMERLRAAIAAKQAHVLHHQDEGEQLFTEIACND